MPDKSWLYNFGMLWAAGAAIGIGQALLSKEQLSWRMLIGKALCSGGLTYRLVSRSELRARSPPWVLTYSRDSLLNT
jgi:hypothetical protein